MHGKSDIYLQVRQKEGRLYSDHVVRMLPHVPADHQFWREWMVRAASARRLMDYLDGLDKPLQILDLGCGNGWLTHQLSRLERTRAVGVDVNSIELAQAARVFGSDTHIQWVEANIASAPFLPASLDTIVVAAAIQYFPDLRDLIHTLAALLRHDGEIHLVDSPLYSPEAVAAARERSRTYYADLGIPAMTQFYHHHAITALDSFNPVYLYKPGAPEDSPFPWIRLRP